MTSAERGETITAMMSMSATGHHLPPFLIFARARMYESLKKGAPSGTAFACNPSGYMTIDLFSVWFEHFLYNVRPSENHPVLLIIDGHSSHSKNLKFIERARVSHVTVLILPPHCSHKLQPLDISFMAPFKAHYANAVESRLRENPGRLVNQYDVAELMGKAFLKASTTSIAASGFRKAGIYPLDRSIFMDSSFAPAATFSRPLFCEPEIKSEADESMTIADKKDNRNEIEPMDGSFTVSPSSILPLPKVSGPRSSKRKRVGEKATLATSSQYTEGLKKTKAIKEITSIKKGRKRIRNTPRNLKSNLTEEDTLCDRCGTCFTDSIDGTGWKSCYQCNIWYHEQCAEISRGKCANC